MVKTFAGLWGGEHTFLKVACFLSVLENRSFRLVNILQTGFKLITEQALVISRKHVAIVFLAESDFISGHRSFELVLCGYRW